MVSAIAGGPTQGALRERRPMGAADGLNLHHLDEAVDRVDCRRKWARPWVEVVGRRLCRIHKGSRSVLQVIGAPMAHDPNRILGKMSESHNRHPCAMNSCNQPGHSPGVRRPKSKAASGGSTRLWHCAFTCHNIPFTSQTDYSEGKRYGRRCKN